MFPDRQDIQNRLSKELAQMQENLGEEDLKSWEEKQQQLLHCWTANCPDPKGRNPLSCAGSIEGRMETESERLKTWMESSKSPCLTDMNFLPLPGSFSGVQLYCSSYPLCLIFVIHHTYSVMVETPFSQKLSLLSHTRGNFLGVVAFLRRLLSVGLPYLFVGQGNPTLQCFLSIQPLWILSNPTLLHQLTCQYSPSCACSYPNGKQGRSFSSDCD